MMSNSRFYTIYNKVLPNNLDVVKFTDSYYNDNSKFTTNINDMGRTINAISYLSSKWFCSKSKLVMSNILDSRGCWQIKQRLNPDLAIYSVTVTYNKNADNKIKYTVSNTAEKDFAYDVYTKFSDMVIKFIMLINGNNSIINQITINYQIKKNITTGLWNYIIDNIMLPDNFILMDTNTKCFQHAELITVTELEINTCYNRLFNVLEQIPDCLYYNGKLNSQTTNQILYNAKTIEQYITYANFLANGKYFN